jgi:hypothetical protein
MCQNFAHRRSWFGLASLFAPVAGFFVFCAGALATDMMRGNPFEIRIAPASRIWFVLTLVGLLFAVIALRRRERRDIGMAGLGLNLIVLLPLAAWVLRNEMTLLEWRQADEKMREDYRLEESEMRQAKNLRFELGHSMPNTVTLSWGSTKTNGKMRFGCSIPIGKPGNVDCNLPTGIEIKVDWPQPRLFELTIKCSQEKSLKLDIRQDYFPDATVEHDGKAIHLPIDLPPGEHQLVIKALVPVYQVLGEQ